MKALRLSLLLAYLLLSHNSNAQFQYVENYTFGASIGYNNLVEPLIWEVNYRPQFTRSTSVEGPYSFGLSAGWQLQERFFFGAEAAWYPFDKSDGFSGYFGIDYFIMTEESVVNSSNTENFDVKPDGYLAPFGALTYKDHIRLKAGYAILVGQSIVVEQYGTQAEYNSIQNQNKSNFMVSLGYIGRF